jgi:outer membrane lipoprotein-sorting protein
LLIKFFILLFIFINIFFNIHATEKQLVINRLIETNNLTFDFIQLTNNKKEVGTCVLAFDNKLVCDYEDSFQKRIIINDKTLVIQQKRYNKTYFYPISKSSFIKIFNKNNLINLIKKSDYQLDNNIRLTYIGKNNEKIVIFFKKNNYDLVGWEVTDQLQNTINFSIKIKYVNSEINPKIFKMPVN